MTQINTSVELKEIFTRISNPHRLLVLHQIPEEENLSIFSILRTLTKEDERAPIYVAVGPEGGFSDEEIEFLLSKGTQCVFLNTNILRTETAAVVSVSIIQQYIIDLMSH